MTNQMVKLWITFLAITLLLAKPSSAAASFSARRRTDSSSHRSPTSSSHYPGGTRKRTMYTGRFCAYQKTKMVPHKIPNGTETFMKQVVKKCHWSALYCKPGVHYVVSSRITYRTVMRRVTKEEWRCCPGFEGENCDNTCFNCTTMNDLTERVSQLEQQIADGLTAVDPNAPPGSVRGVKGAKGEVGPRGPAGETGDTGPRGPDGVAGAKGEPGLPGAQGDTGPRGAAGENGPRGSDGPKGDQGLPGGVGPRGRDGKDGERGLAGPNGDSGPPGTAGVRGERGERGSDGRDGATGPMGPVGPEGPVGLRGERGETGQMGPPGPPGGCGCPGTIKKGTGETTPSPGGQEEGSSACSFEGNYYSENEMWTNDDCEECLCVDGSITCLEISCPVIDCRYKYKPAGYCCETCCPVQHVDEGLPSGEFFENDDGASETIVSDVFDSEHGTYEYDEYYDETDFDPLGCPIATNTEELSAKISQTDKCSMRKDAGPCSGKYQRYYYDKLRGECAVFTYGGCEGNANAFATLEECRQACVPGVSTTTQSDRESQAPDELVEVNADPDRWDVLPRRCREPKHTGDCRAAFERFYYDVSEDRCKMFVFGGCKPNGNNFMSPWDCRDACGGQDPVFTDAAGPERCTQPKETGPCRASMSRYYYNTESSSCEEFVFGGCRGNDNNFETQQECESTCIDEEVTSRTIAPGLCTEPLEPGPCRAMFYRFFYDAEKDRCSSFIYSGCLGNSNNFATPEECRQTCGGGRVNYTITIPGPKEKPSVTGPATSPGPRGERGPPGPPGPMGPPSIGLPGLQGPAGPPGPPGPATDASTVELYKKEIESLRSEVQQLAKMVLSHLGDVGKHVDPTKTDIPDNSLEDLFTNTHDSTSESPDYPDYLWATYEDEGEKK